MSKADNFFVRIHPQIFSPLTSTQPDRDVKIDLILTLLVQKMFFAKSTTIQTPAPKNV